MASEDSFKKAVLWPLALLVLTPVATLLGSKATEGKWLAWLQLVPRWGYAALASGVVLWLLGLAVMRRRTALRRRSAPGVFFASVPVAGYVHVNDVTHFGVKWRLLLPRESMFSSRPVIDENQAEIDTPPLCPNCDTELEEAPRFFGGYKWSCVACGFSVKSRDDRHTQAERVERIVKPHIRADIKKARDRGLL